MFFCPRDVHGGCRKGSWPLRGLCGNQFLSAVGEPHCGWRPPRPGFCHQLPGLGRLGYLSMRTAVTLWVFEEHTERAWPLAGSSVHSHLQDGLSVDFQTQGGKEGDVISSCFRQQPTRNRVVFSPRSATSFQESWYLSGLSFCICKMGVKWFN